MLGVATPSGGLDSGSSADSLESLITIGILTLIGAILADDGRARDALLPRHLEPVENGYL